MSISIATIIPLYFLLRKFVEYKYALIGAALFVLDPRVIQNSFSGLTDPLFIFLGTATLALFLSDKKSAVYASFATLGLFSLTRYEGLLLLVPITIMFFVRFRKDKVFIRYVIAFAIFVLVLAPLAYVRVQITGNDGLTSHLLAGTKVAAEDMIPNSATNKFSATKGLEVFARLSAWSTLPTYFLFIIPGAYFLFKNKNYKSYAVILASVAFLLPALYASSRGIEETRYFLMVSIVYNIASILAIRKISEKIGKRKTLVFVMLFVITTSILFLNWKTDNQHERESAIIAEEVAKRTNVINDYHPESVYLRTVGFNDYQDFAGKKSAIQGKVTTLFTSEFTTLEEFLAYGKSQGLEYLIIDDQENRQQFLTDVFNNEKDYPYLIKDFDSADIGLKYHVKIFKIDYRLLELVN
ncbi:ArnT family glycosyltransferase [Candidatus Nitrosotenuis cloacae]|uniref:ArnT family glycosyltransferase n=1 Tax=Candidatus Nitrosotenuis cloacae TaxID=1603555 RepID=UPI002282FBA1|nr:glycosyltransferase family 39 protein [Candidatus Nitrosotenuis cloacae]